MSFKVYNGWDVSSARWTGKGLVRACQEAQVAFRAAALFGVRSHFSPEQYSKEWSDLSRRVWESSKKRLRDPFDFAASVVFLAAPKQLLAITYWERNNVFDEVWAKSVFAPKEYGYWDNTDPLEGVPDEEWAARAKAWKAALPGAGVPGELGLTFQFVAEAWLPTPDEFRGRRP